jgi:uncharacterized membrane protein YqjE
MNARSPGILAHAAAFSAATARYVRARLTLAGVELRDAGARCGLAAALVAGALFVTVLGYVFLVITVVFTIAAAFEERHAWLWVMGAAALLHLAAAAAMVFFAWTRVRAGAFPDTLAEFRKDQAWLIQLAKKP